MYEYLMSLPPDELVAGVTALMVIVLSFFAFGVYYSIKAIATWFYCRHRQKHPRTNRCLFSGSCPTADNCPYNVLFRKKKPCLKNMFGVFKERGEGNENECE